MHNRSHLIPSLQAAFELATRLRTSLSRIIRGRNDTIELVITALLADGHVLLEDYPGSGKTTLSKALGRLISRDEQANPSADYIQPFRRIQFTPDMLLGDVLGVNIFEPKSGSFRFLHGPIFAHIVLADELNRTGPKVQAAFLECMAEKQVMIDNQTHHLHPLFFVLGTQNPLDLAGTYPLPLVQLDRFLFRLPMSYVDRATEIELLATHSQLLEALDSAEPVCSPQELLAARQLVETIRVSERLQETIVDILQATRSNQLLQFGASTRAGIMLQRALRAAAAVAGRDYANEDDLKRLIPFVLGHRLKFHPGAGDPASALDDLVRPHLERLIQRGVR